MAAKQHDQSLDACAVGSAGGIVYELLSKGSGFAGK